MTSPQDFGWWIESTDEEIYGPVTRATLIRFLTEGVISPNTAVRHCSQETFAAAADLGFSSELTGPAPLRTGDTLGKSWPKKSRDRIALAESDVQCAYHKKPAILSCIRCLAPYCSKCQLKKRNATYFMCKKCQAGIYNRRILAYFFDSFTFIFVPIVGIGLPAIFVLGPATGEPLINLLNFGGTVLFFVRDAMFGGAGPGKRIFGLKVVKHEDGVSPLSYGQGIVRSLAHLIPLFNLVDASSPYRDPLQRRYGDAWAKTRVLDTDAKLAKVRENVRQKLENKGIELEQTSVTTLPEFARIG